jgi:hypothetical protein
LKKRHAELVMSSLPTGWSSAQIVGFRGPRSCKPHWLLMVRPGNPQHPVYRMAINETTTQPDDHLETEYPVVSSDERLPPVAWPRKSLKRPLIQHSACLARLAREWTNREVQGRSAAGTRLDDEKESRNRIGA